MYTYLISSTVEQVCEIGYATGCVYSSLCLFNYVKPCLWVVPNINWCAMMHVYYMSGAYEPHMCVNH